MNSIKIIAICMFLNILIGFSIGGLQVNETNETIIENKIQELFGTYDNIQEEAEKHKQTGIQGEDGEGQGTLDFITLALGNLATRAISTFEGTLNVIRFIIFISSVTLGGIIIGIISSPPAGANPVAGMLIGIIKLFILIINIIMILVFLKIVRAGSFD